MEAFIKYGAGVVATIALVLSVISVNKPTTAVTTNPDGTQTMQSYGSVSGPDTSFDYYNENGVFHYQRVASLIAATTTPCVIKSPSATTTLETFTMNVTTGTSTAPNLTLATSTITNATTSLVFNKTYGASTQFTLNWHPTTENALVSPNIFVSVGAAGVPYGFTLVGTCSATFRKV